MRPTVLGLSGIESVVGFNAHPQIRAGVQQASDNSLCGLARHLSSVLNKPLVLDPAAVVANHGPQVEPFRDFTGPTRRPTRGKNQFIPGVQPAPHGLFGTVRKTLAAIQERVIHVAERDPDMAEAVPEFIQLPGSAGIEIRGVCLVCRQCGCSHGWPRNVWPRGFSSNGVTSLVVMYQSSSSCSSFRWMPRYSERSIRFTVSSGSRTKS